MEPSQCNWPWNLHPSIQQCDQPTPSIRVYANQHFNRSTYPSDGTLLIVFHVLFDARVAKDESRCLQCCDIIEAGNGKRGKGTPTRQIYWIASMPGFNPSSIVNHLNSVPRLERKSLSKNEQSSWWLGLGLELGSVVRIRVRIVFGG